MKEKGISMAKKESQDGKSKKGLPRLMELAIYFIIQEIVGAYPDFSTLDVPKVLGYGGLALGGVLLNVLLPWSCRTLRPMGLCINAKSTMFPTLQSSHWTTI